MTVLIDISPELESQLQKEAARRGITTSEYVRMLLEEQLLTDNRERQPLCEDNAWFVLKSMMGTVEGPPDWSSELDHYLYATPKRSETR